MSTPNIIACHFFVFRETQTWVLPVYQSHNWRTKTFRRFCII